jgi:hypothetical protein
MAPGTHNPAIAAVHTQPTLTREIVDIFAAIGCRKRKRDENAAFEDSSLEVNMLNKRPQPPRPDRIRSIRGSFSWIDHRFLRQGFDQGLSRLEKLQYFVLIAVSNCEGVSFYSDERLGETLEICHAHELTGGRNELVARDLIAFKDGIYQVLDLPPEPKKH